MSLLNLELHKTAENARTLHVIRELPVLVILPHSRCNCRCVMCDIWRIRQIREITAADLEPHMDSLRKLKVQWVVFSGGEPLMHSDLSALARLLRREGIRTTLLTAGLTLARHAAQVARDMDDVIVSIDGPREIHDRIRGVPDAYRRLERGILGLREHRASLPIHGRCTVQRSNFRHLRAAVGTAHELGLNSISFLAADMSSEAFNHPAPQPLRAVANIALSMNEVDGLIREIEGLIRDGQEEIQSGFIRESPEKLQRIVAHYSAHLGLIHFAAPRCNAPWVSAVIESDGAVRPCFFHRPIGNLRDGTLVDILNSDAAMQFRTQLDISNDAVCQRCVCSLFLDRENASLMRSSGGEARSIFSADPCAN
jgi:MoaA/NifB/PqqE/SkfB family radical SAM enzyme